jgi:hypothetical protein
MMRTYAYNRFDCRRMLVSMARLPNFIIASFSYSKQFFDELVDRSDCICDNCLCWEGRLRDRRDLWFQLTALARAAMVMVVECNVPRKKLLQRIVECEVECEPMRALLEATSWLTSHEIEGFLLDLVDLGYLEQQPVLSATELGLQFMVGRALLNERRCLRLQHCFSFRI